MTDFTALDTCHIGDCRAVMRAMVTANVQVQCVVTSPPYWSLRNYFASGQIGLEPTLRDYLSSMVEVFDLVRDLLADDGTLWLNLGDGYATGSGGGAQGATGQRSSRRFTAPTLITNRAAAAGVPEKSLLGIPWRVAFALQDAGWMLRQDIIWNKPNPLPESVTDRCTKAHEYLFLLTKSPRYYYDAAAIAEPISNSMKGNARTFRGGGSYTQGRSFDNSAVPSDCAGVGMGAVDGRGGVGQGQGWGQGQGRDSHGNVVNETGTRNRRSVWTVATEPCPVPGGHYATMPQALVEPCVLAGSRVGDVVFDPFFGSGTVGQVAQRLGRRWLGCEINSDYAVLQELRTAQQAMAV